MLTELQKAKMREANKKRYSDSKYKAKRSIDNQNFRNKNPKYMKEYHLSHPYYQRKRYAKDLKFKERKRKNYAKRQRTLGFEPINDWFPNSHAHHINRIQVIYIPKLLHLEHYGHRLNRLESMIEINRAAFQYLTETMKQL